MDKISLCKAGQLADGAPAQPGEHLGALAARFAHIHMWGGGGGTWARRLDEIAPQTSAART